MVHLFSKLLALIRRNLILVSVLVIFAAAIVVWSVVLGYRLNAWMNTGSESAGHSAKNLGVTFVPLTSALSPYSILHWDSGALVTEVTSGSRADRAGLRPGDVILSFNGVKLEGEASLLSLVMSCPEDASVSVDVCRGSAIPVKETLCIK